MIQDGNAQNKTSKNVLDDTKIIGNVFEKDWSRVMSKDIGDILMLKTPKEVERAKQEIEEIKSAVKRRYRFVISTFDFFASFSSVEYKCHLSESSWKRFIRASKIVTPRNVKEVELIENLFQLANEEVAANDHSFVVDSSKDDVDHDADSNANGNDDDDDKNGDDDGGDDDGDDDEDDDDHGNYDDNGNDDAVFMVIMLKMMLMMMMVLMTMVVVVC